MFCPNCGAEVPDGSEFCGKCGAKMRKGSGSLLLGSVDRKAQGSASHVPESAEFAGSGGAAAKKPKKLAVGWIVLISLLVAVMVFLIVYLPIYYRAPLVPASSTTGDGRASYIYTLDKKTGVLTVTGQVNGDDDSNPSSYYQMSPYYDTQWLIALSETSSPYKTQSLQLCTVDENYSIDVIAEYVLANYSLVADGTIKEVDYSINRRNSSWLDEDTTYTFDVENGRVTEIHKSDVTDNGTVTNDYDVEYDSAGRITKIFDDASNQDGGIFEYDAQGLFKDYVPIHSNGFSGENDGNHLISYSPDYGVASGSTTNFTFDGDRLTDVAIKESAGWAGGGYELSYNSTFHYSGSHVTEIDTRGKADGEDASSSSSSFHLTPRSKVTFQYKRIL